MACARLLREKDVRPANQKKSWISRHTQEGVLSTYL